MYRSCRSSCPAGYYLSPASACILGSEVRDRVCIACSSRCPAGYYSLGRCDGSTTYDTTRCVPCGGCQAGQYQIGFCDGTTSTDATQCAPCVHTSCKPLHVLVGQCTGLGTVDTSSCVPCTEPTGVGCGANQYMGTMCSPSSLYDGVCTNCKLSCPAGQYKRIPCTGSTSSDLVCANCTQNCPLGHYVANLCSGQGSKDTATCEPCTCPSGLFAPNNTCTGTTTSNTLRCIACTNASSCPAGHYLSGNCSALTNTACTPCRTRCKSAEIEVQQCSGGLNRRCLPDASCFQDCPSGMYESRACSPPDTRQVCSPCRRCPPGFYVSAQCSPKNDTQCARCTSSVCTDDRYNAQFGRLGECQGNELNDTALCGVITESYGERCSVNTYRFASSAPLPYAFPSPLLLGDAYLAFDVHPARNVYAYCSGNRIYTYDYEGVKESHVDYAYVPEHCSDIRFTSAGKYLMVTSLNSSRLFRCDPSCLTPDPFVYSPTLRRYV